MTSRAPPESHSVPSLLDSADDALVSRSEDVNTSAAAHDAYRAHQRRTRLPIPPSASHPSTFEALDVRMSINPARESAATFESPTATTLLNSNSQDSLPSLESATEQDIILVDAQRGRRAAKMEGRLPENDGMRSLRLRLHEIRKLAISTEEKAKRMHALMMEEYIAHKAATPSPVYSDDGDSRSLSEEPAALDVGLAAMPVDPSNPYNIRAGDLEPSFSPLAVHTRQEQDLSESMEIEDRPLLGCMHYLRNVKIQCFDCHRWFPCRHCHDQANDLPFPHSLRRKLTRNMLCMLCQTPQPASQVCANCEEWAADYYCPICKLWDNDSNKSIYHCDDCGICRLGEGLGKDFVHCKKCNVCISISTSAAHPCVEGATEGDCPLCLEEMFASRAKVVSLPCGHYMHASCYKDLMGVTYKCPVCSKSAVNMELQWRKLDDEIESQPMPEDEEEELDRMLPQIEGHIDERHVNEFEQNPQPSRRRPRTVWIGCNDCGSRCWTPFHWLGLKCRVCDSYNTSQMAPTVGYETETERLIRQQQIHRQHDFTGDEVLRDAGISTDDASRVDSRLCLPASPSLLAVPASPGSPSSGRSSPGRYFVQNEELRRPSFTVPRFSTPTLPTLANLPEMPRLPRMPNMSQLPNMPTIPNLPHMPNLPNMPHLPNIPNMPELGLPRFSPYDMFDTLSRSLSPMRYYLQGQDVQEGDFRRERNRSPTSVHSDPTTNATSSKRRRSTGLRSADETGSLTSGSQSLSSNHDSDDGINPVTRDGEDDNDDESETESDELSDAELIDDELDMVLPGHR